MKNNNNLYSDVIFYFFFADSSSTSTSERDQNNVIYNDNELTYPLNVSVIMLNRRTALLQWWPRTALMHQDVEIVFTPEYSK